MIVVLALICEPYAAADAIYSRLPPRAAVPVGLMQLSPESRPIVRKISFLFLIDAFGGGFIGSALFAYFFAERYGVPAPAGAGAFPPRPGPAPLPPPGGALVPPAPPPPGTRDPT